jgi:hypothetical protein
MNEERKPTKPIIAPYFFLARATWLACVSEWDSETSEFRHRIGFQAFASYSEAIEASRFRVIGSSGVTTRSRARQPPSCLRREASSPVIRPTWRLTVAVCRHRMPLGGAGSRLTREGAGVRCGIGSLDGRRLSLGREGTVTGVRREGSRGRGGRSPCLNTQKEKSCRSIDGLS